MLTLKKKCFFMIVLFVLLSTQAFSQDGQLDTTFAGTGGTIVYIGSFGNDEAHSVAIQSDGKIVAGGFAYFSSGNEYTFALIRLKSNGELDSTFGTNGIVTTGFGGSNTDARAYSIVIQPDGKIIAGGYSSTGSNGTQHVFTLVRYNINGSIDSTFGTGGVVTTAVGTSDDKIYSLIIQQDEKIIAGGTSYNSLFTTGTEYDFALARYNTNGSLDASFGNKGIVTTRVSFNNNSGGDDEVRSLVLQSDGKIIAAGYSYGGYAMVRYNSNGTPDNTFGNAGIVLNSVSGSDYDNAIALQSDGKIVSAGASYLNNRYVFSLIRNNPDGSLDNSFGVNGVVATQIDSSDDGINALAIQSDGKIIVGGYSENNSQNYLFALARYNTDGSLDKTFGYNGVAVTAVGLGDDKINALAIQSDGKIIAAGASLYNNFYDLYGFSVVRYTGSSVTAIKSFNPANNIPTDYSLFQNYPNPFNPTTTIEFSIPKSEFVTLNVFDVIGRKVASLVNENKEAGKYSIIFNGSKLSSGIYFYRLQAGNYSAVKKLILLK